MSTNMPKPTISQIGVSKPSTSIALISIARPTFDVPLAQSVADSALAQLEEAGYTVVGTGAELLMDGESAERAIASLAEQPFDLLILLQASFADSSMAVQIAQSVQSSPHSAGMPLLLWAVPDERSGGRLRLNSLCGINLAGHALTRQGIAYEYALTPADCPEILQQVNLLTRAGSARRALRKTRIGLVGQHPDGFDTCIYQEEGLQQLFGSQVVALSLDETLQNARDVETPQRTQFIERVRAHADNLDELDQTALSGTAGVYQALKDVADTQQLDGIAVRCWPEFFTELGCAACGAMSMLCEERVATSCEADVNGTLTLVLLQALSGEQSFITDLVSVDAESDTGVLWHCGLAPVSMADPDGTIQGTVHSNRKLPLLFEFTLKPGRVTIARLNQTPAVEGGYRLVIGGGDMISAPRSFGGTSGVVRFDKAAPDVFDTVMREGLEHHFCITYGDHRDALRAFADLVGLPVLELT